MIRLFILLLFINISLPVIGQVPDVSGVVSSVCDSLDRLTVPISELEDDERISIVRQALVDNQIEWQKAYSDLKITNEREEYNLIEFLYQMLQLDCPEYRQIEDSLDQYLVKRKEYLRPIYFRTKHFRRALEDNRPIDYYLKFLSDTLKSTPTFELIKASMTQIENYERNCTVTNMWVGIEGNTFRIRYSDLISGHTMFQIDLTYKDTTDELIDRIYTKDQAILEIERQERIEFNKKVESGKIKIPPPPPPK
jgi:hypothetical protein